MEKRKVAPFAFVALLTLSAAMPSRAEAQFLSLEAVLKDCEKKTIIMGRDERGGIGKVGERISGYCQGFLEGVFTVLVRARTICVKDKNASPEFLLSTVLTYRTETKSQDNDAASVMESALKRAFSCSN